VFTHGSSPKIHEQVDDIISGKGKGLIFLLTGPPGLGKTLTAGVYFYSLSKTSHSN
jgi:DNA polymerase III delta prime subunit